MPTIYRTFAVVTYMIVAVLKGVAIAERPLTYYVDSITGADRNSGLSPEVPWRSLNRVNRADLKPGDKVCFRRGCQWRGSLRPRGGAEGAPVVYMAYGEGTKPLLLGSVSKNRVSDWERQGENLWATIPCKFAPSGSAVKLTDGVWHVHTEAGVEVLHETVDWSGSCIQRISCKTSGKAGNHIQLSGPKMDVQEGTFFILRFRARCTVPFEISRVAVMGSAPPWQLYAPSWQSGPKVSSEWRTYTLRFHARSSAGDGRIVIYLGGVLPPGSVFEFQPLERIPIDVYSKDPLYVDVGNIIFDHGKACGWKKWNRKDLTAQNDYFYDPATWSVWVFSKECPAEKFKDIELALNRHIVSQENVHHVIYDGLALKYGAGHGFGGGNTNNIVIRYCDISYMGGGHQYTNTEGHPVRYGNGIEFWGAAHDNLVEGCRLWEIYDAALSNQGRGPTSKQVNITYRDNVIWNSEYSFEYWNTPETAFTSNIQFIHNTCVDAGVVWSHAQRPDPTGSHLKFDRNTAQTDGFVVKYNIFCNSTGWGSRFDRGWNPLPNMNYNLWYEEKGPICRFFGKLFGSDDLFEYQKETGLDANSKFEKPEFVGPQARDYRLKDPDNTRNRTPDGLHFGACTE